jgi:hypothetical protein
VSKDEKIVKAKTKTGKTEAEKLDAEKKKRAELIIAEGKAFAGKLEILKINNRVTESIEKEKQKQDEFNKGLKEATLIGEVFQADIFAKKPIQAVQSFSDFVKGNILPQLGTSFQTFFDDILMRGQLSFASLGKSILSTFASVLANQATTGVLALLGDKESQKKGNIFSSFGKLLGIGGGLLGKEGGEVAKEGAKGALGGLGGLIGGVGIALGAVSIISGLLKKKPQAPLPAQSSSISTSAAGSAQDFGGGRVVFEISGTNLVGVLNRAGAQLKRYGP